MKQTISTITTERLVLRPWKEKDLESFAELNADPRVREFFSSVLSQEESAAEYSRIVRHFEQRGWGLFAISLKEEENFIGFIGLHYEDFLAPFTPAVEIGWRLAFNYWNQGYATEGALACLKYGFKTLKLNEIVSFTPTQNIRSQHVMKKIGMHHNPKDDFDHPKLIEGHRLARHVLYRLNGLLAAIPPLHGVV